jgi:UDP-glucose 4-epimerase
MVFKDKVLLITGGTGSFGNTVLKRFLSTEVGEIRIYSRDEKKQDDMRICFNNPKIKFLIGGKNSAFFWKKLLINQFYL